MDLTERQLSRETIYEGKILHIYRVHILDGRIAHCLLLEIFTNKGIGTAILGDKETKYYHE